MKYILTALLIWASAGLADITFTDPVVSLGTSGGINFYEISYDSPTPPFSPTDIAGMALWLDGDDADALTLATNGAVTNVTIWADKSGNSRDYHQTTQASQPSYVTAGNVLANKYRYYVEEVVKRKLADKKLEHLEVDQVLYLTKEYNEKTHEGIVMDELGLRRICCRRHILTHVDIGT